MATHGVHDEHLSVKVQHACADEGKQHKTLLGGYWIVRLRGR